MHRLFSTFWYLKICQKYFFKDRKVQFFYWKAEIQGFLPMFIWMRWYNAVGLQRQTWKKPALKCSWSRAHVGSIHKQKHQKTHDTPPLTHYFVSTFNFYLFYFHLIYHFIVLFQIIFFHFTNLHKLSHTPGKKMENVQQLCMYKIQHPVR